MPDVQLAAFRNFAAPHNESAQIELKGNTGELETRGLWGRFKNFFSAEGQAAKNQATVQAFCRSVTREMGADLGKAAKALLGAALADGKPLKGFMIQQTLQFLEHEQGRIEQHNQDTLARCLTAQPGQDKSPFEAQIAGYLPEGVALRPGDTDEMQRILRQTVDQLTARHAPLTLAKLETEISRYRGGLQTTDGAFMARLDRLGQEGSPPNITGAQIQELRPLIIAAGVRTEGDLRAALELMLEFQGKIPEMQGLAGSVDLMGFLENLTAAKERIFTDNGCGERSDVADIMALALQGAFKLGGTPENVIQEIAAKLTGTAAQDVLNAINTTVDRSRDPVPALRLKGTFTTLLNPLTVMGAVTAAQSDNLPFMGGVSEFSPQLKTYCHLTGLLTDTAVAETLGSFQAIRDQLHIPPKDLALLAATLDSPNSSLGANARYLRQDAANILFSVLSDMKRAQPDGFPFTPQTVWNAVFRQEPGADITPENLVVKLTEAVQKNLDERIDRQGISDRQITLTAWPNAMLAAMYGINPLRAFDLLLAPNQAGASVEFRDIFPLSGSAPTEESGLAKMTADLHRLVYGANPPPVHASLTVNGGEAISLNGGSIADETQRENYRAGKQDNPIIQTVMSQVRTLCGEGIEATPQRASVYLLLSQAALGQLRYMSALVGARLDEHTACEMKLDRLENGDVRLRLETVEGSRGYGRFEFMIAPNGDYRQTDFQLSHERPNGT
jgi:hypothetical protein